jgi:hypothetical protein
VGARTAAALAASSAPGLAWKLAFPLLRSLKLLGKLGSFCKINVSPGPLPGHLHDQPPTVPKKTQSVKIFMQYAFSPVVLMEAWRVNCLPQFPFLNAELLAAFVP